MKFLPYQWRWIQDESPLKLYQKSRRTGITYATSYRACRKCLRSARRDSHFVQWVSSRDEITAREFITDYVAHWARMANRIARGMSTGWEEALGLDGEQLAVVDEKHGITARVVIFRNGARIYSLSSNPLAFAGKGGDVLIVEWDLHPDQAAIYDMAYPCITWGGQLELVSAFDPDGSEHTEFARMCRDCRNGLRPNVSFHRTTIYDAIEAGLVETINETRIARGMPPQTREEFLASLRAGCRSRAAFDSQYGCVPNQASGAQLIAAEELQAAVTAALDMVRIHCSGQAELDAHPEWLEREFWRESLPDDRSLALGFDIARSGDLSGIWINAAEPETRCWRLTALVTLKNCRFETQQHLVRAMFDAADRLVGCGDKTGLGMAVCEALENRYPGRFMGVNFAASKIQLGTTLQAVFEQHRQRLPEAYPEILADLAGLRKTAAGSGRLMFTESGNELLPDSHCDMAWSCALALHAGETLDAAGTARAVPAAERGRGFNESRRYDDALEKHPVRRWR